MSRARVRTLSAEGGRPECRSSGGTSVNVLIRGLSWPIVSLLLIGASHFLAEAVRPSLQAVFVPPVVMPIYLAVGGWAGIAVVRAGGSFIHGLVGGAIMGALPVSLQVVGFGLILGRSSDAVATAALFGLLALFWGGSIGSGIAVSLRAGEQPQTESVPQAGTAVARA
jgi:hypothetical protein